MPFGTQVVTWLSSVLKGGNEIKEQVQNPENTSSKIMYNAQAIIWHFIILFCSLEAKWLLICRWIVWLLYVQLLWMILRVYGCVHMCTQLWLTYVTPRTVAHQDPLTLEFSRQEYWSGLPFPSSDFKDMLYIKIDRLPRWLIGKESACQCRRHRRCGLDLWVRKIPWRRKWQPLQYSYMDILMDRRAWRATVHGVTKSQTELSTHACVKFGILVYCFQKGLQFSILASMHTLYNEMLQALP